MHRSTWLFLGLLAVMGGIGNPRRAVGEDLPAPARKTLDPGRPALPIEVESPTPWQGASPLPAAASGPSVAPPTPAEPADDQGVPRITSVAPPKADEFDPSAWDPKLPPIGRPIKDRISLRTDPLAFGSVETFDVGDGVVAYVMGGNPVVEGDDFEVKAERVVVWVDKALSAGGFGMMAGADAKAGPASANAAPLDLTGSTAGLQENPERFAGLIALYAVGTVDLVTGTEAERAGGLGLLFRASELYMNRRTKRALLIEPRFDTVIPLDSTPLAKPTSKLVPKTVPLHIRAEKLRVLAEGYAVFEKCDVSTSRTNDRIGLEVGVLTMEEYADASAGKQAVPGFHGAGSQRFTGYHIVGRAERLPVLYIGQASFSELSEFPVKPHATTGSRSSVGRYAIIGASRRQKIAEDAYLEWLVNVGGFTKRGPVAGVELDWRMPRKGSKPARLSGSLDTYGFYDRSGDDRNDFQAGEGTRWLAKFENRYEISESLRLDTELNAFSDRGVNPEFFESDSRNHKDRETYARLRWMSGGTASAFTVGKNLRDFQTETLEQPGLSLWSESLPLGQSSGPVHLAFDLSSRASIARLVRHFDEDLPDQDYEGLRADVTERVYAPFDVGDVRISPFVGVRWTGYFDRTDGGADVDRTALEGGVRANLQLHNDFAKWGGTWRLDGLRHIVDLDAGAYAVEYDATDPADVPFFDSIDQEESRNEVFVEVRNRLETRRSVGGDRSDERDGERRNATLADLRIRGSFWPDGVGPYGRRGPGEISMWGMAEIVPDKAWLRGESVVGLEGTTFRHWSLGAQYSPIDSMSAAIGVRHIQDEILAPWFDVYHRWNEKWGARVNGIRDFDSDVRWNFRCSLVRFSEDHVWEFGASVRDNGDDVGIFLNFQPAVGGIPVNTVFSPRETIDYTP